MPTIKEDYTIVTIEVADEKNTKVIIEDNSNGRMYTGEARRNPKDKFDYTIGIKLALDRAIDEMETARAVRNIIEGVLGHFFGGLLFSNRY